MHKVLKFYLLLLLALKARHCHLFKSTIPWQNYEEFYSLESYVMNKPKVVIAPLTYLLKWGLPFQNKAIRSLDLLIPTVKIMTFTFPARWWNCFNMESNRSVLFLGNAISSVRSPDSTCAILFRFRNIQQKSKIIFKLKAVSVLLWCLIYLHYSS